MRWAGFYLKGDMYEAELPPPVGVCCRQLSAQAGPHRHLRQIQAALLHVLFKELAGFLLQHLKRHLPHLRQ